VSWIERMLEERLAKAAAEGELDAPHLAGKPLPDIDTQRGQGWWAEQFVRREHSHDRRQAAEGSAAEARAGFWKAASIEELRGLVDAANQAIAAVNINLVPGDQLELFDWNDVANKWRTIRSR
jgi:hypothetical protein